MTGRYAKQTDVPWRQTRDDVEKLLLRYGYHEFGVVQTPKMASVSFRVRGAGHRVVLPLPDPEAPEFAPKGAKNQHTKYKSEAKLREQAALQETDARWRALLLVLRAQLEYIAITGGDAEVGLAAYRLLPDGTTVAERVAQSGNVPALTWVAARQPSLGEP